MRREKKIVLLTLGTILIILITGFTSIELTKQKPIIIPLQTVLLKPVALASTSDFAVFAGNSITNTGNTTISGELGLDPGLWVVGLPEDIFIRTKQTDSKKTSQAKLDLTAAYDDAESRRSEDVVNLHGNIGGLTLTPGLYHSASSLVISTGNLTFDALGNPDAVFIIQIASSLTTRPNTRVILKRGALASNIFWQVGESAIFGSHSMFKGTVMALNSIKFYSGATLEGRGLSRRGEVDLSCNIIKN